MRLRAAPRGGGGACRAATTTRRAAPALYAADALETTGATAAEPERQGRPASAPRPAGSAVSVTGGGARTNGQLLHEIRAIFVEHLSLAVESPEAELLQSGLVDSVTLVELVLSLEARFGVSLPFDSLEIDDFRTLNRIAGLIERSTAQGS
ncbi:MAG: hypothetical protein DMD53_13235 [Gemmatimonadetes bacterium]|nr:MAG: hypothetical protein DMD53_13235 [Gemmatimonadota bacterium]